MLEQIASTNRCFVPPLLLVSLPRHKPVTVLNILLLLVGMFFSFRHQCLALPAAPQGQAAEEGAGGQGGGGQAGGGAASQGGNRQGERTQPPGGRRACCQAQGEAPLIQRLSTTGGMTNPVGTLLQPSEPMYLNRRIPRCHDLITHFRGRSQHSNSHQFSQDDSKRPVAAAPPSLLHDPQPDGQAAAGSCVTPNLAAGKPLAPANVPSSAKALPSVLMLASKALTAQVSPAARFWVPIPVLCLAAMRLI